MTITENNAIKRNSRKGIPFYQCFTDVTHSLLPIEAHIANREITIIGGIVSCQVLRTAVKNHNKTKLHKRSNIFILDLIGLI